MTTCPDDGILQSCLDDALEPAFLAPLDTHLAACPACAERLDRLAARAARVKSALALLGEMPGAASAPAPRFAISRLATAAACAATLVFGVFLLDHPAWERAQPAPADGLWQLQPTGETFIPLGGSAPLQLATVEEVSLPVETSSPEALTPTTGWIKAEIIVDQNGTPRAYRLVR